LETSRPGAVSAYTYAWKCAIDSSVASGSKSKNMEKPENSEKGSQHFI